MTYELVILQKRAAKTQVSASSGSSGLEQEPPQEAVDDEDVCADTSVMEQLEKYRQAWQESKEIRCHDFQVSVLGGAWTAKHKGVIADAFSGAAKGELALNWCRARGMPKSARYEISAYGEEFASIFARAWCSKMQYALNVCHKLENDLHRRSSEEHDSWVPPSDLARLQTALAGAARAQRRLRQIRALG